MEDAVRRLESISATDGALLLILVVASLVQLFDGMDVLLTGYALPGIGREFNLPTPIYSGLVLSSTLIGMFIGSLVWSALEQYVSILCCGHVLMKCTNECRSPRG